MLAGINVRPVEDYAGVIPEGFANTLNALELDSIRVHAANTDPVEAAETAISARDQGFDTMLNHRFQDSVSQYIGGKSDADQQEWLDWWGTAIGTLNQDGGLKILVMKLAIPRSLVQQLA